MSLRTVVQSAFRPDDYSVDIGAFENTRMTIVDHLRDVALGNVDAKSCQIQAMNLFLRHYDAEKNRAQREKHFRARRSQTKRETETNEICGRACAPDPISPNKQKKEVEANGGRRSAVYPVPPGWMDHEDSKLEQEMASRAAAEFSAFVRYMAQSRLLSIGDFQRIISHEVDQFHADVKSGKNPRLLILAPPQHGKSEIISRLYPAWILGHEPYMRVISCSYSQALASRMNEYVQGIINDARYQRIFPTSLARKNKYLIQPEGSLSTYWCAGAGGSITGMSADIAIIDDPIKDFKQAHSSKQRDSLWDWFTSTLSTRLSPKSGIIVVMTRWHKDDLAGRLLENIEAGVERNWRVLKFPAISTSEGDLFRSSSGQALSPDRYAVDWLEDKKKSVGPSVWESLYQQNPQNALHCPIRTSWFKKYGVLPALDHLCIFADTALKTGTQHDFSVLQLWGLSRDRRGIYLVDQKRGRWEAFELKSITQEFYRQAQTMASTLPGRPTLRGIYVEDSASGTHLVQEIRRECGIPILPIRHAKDKLTRFYDVQSYIESGYVFIPEKGDFIGDFLNECSNFNIQMTHAHDDQVDAMTDAITTLLADVRSKPNSYADLCTALSRITTNTGLTPQPTSASPADRYFYRKRYERFNHLADVSLSAYV